jgi:hypothetical protein
LDFDFDFFANVHRFHSFFDDWDLVVSNIVFAHDAAVTQVVFEPLVQP